MPEDYELRRRCEALVASLALRPTCDVEEVSAAVSERRGRRIRLAPVPIAQPGLCGVWMATATEDWVFYAENTTAYHRRHIILHEFGHMLYDHQGVGSGYVDLARALAPDVDPRTIERVLGRDAYTDTQEREAELFAAIAMRRSAGATDADLPDPESSVEADALRRVDAALRGTNLRAQP